MESKEAKREAAIKTLQRTFGNLDRDVLASVLEVANDDVQAATTFLQAEADGYAFNPNQPDSIPSDYPGQSVYVGWGVHKKKKKRVTEKDEPKAVEKNEGIDIPLETRIKNLFVQESTYQDHYDAQQNHYHVYTAAVVLLSKFNVEISKGSKTRMLAACWARHDFALANYLLSQEENFNLPQVLGALNLLDAARKVRAIEKRIVRLEKQGLAKPKKFGQLRSVINDLNKEAHIGSVSGALAKKIRRWVKKIPAEKLTFFALNLPKQPWKDLADIVHLHPKNDFQCPFLELAFNEKPAPDSMLAECAKLDADNCVEISTKWHVPYSYIRLHVKPLPEGAKAAVAAYSPLDTLIWYHEELACPDVDSAIAMRLQNGEEPKFGYGKLMERMLYLKRIAAPFFPLLVPIADRRMRQLHLALESPVAVIGDASFSMDVAIRCATIIGSVLTMLTSAELKFFNDKVFDPVVVPRTVSQVLEVATATRADGLTAPACALEDYYHARKVIKFFIVVTDEIENEKFKGQYFPDLFLKYHKEVYPAKIVFVSFLEDPSAKGRMVTALENMGIVPLQFKLDSNRPDLQKLDSLLGLLATESSFFAAQVNEVARELSDKGLAKVLEITDTEIIASTATSTTCSSLISNINKMDIEGTEEISREVEKFVEQEREKSEKRKGKEKDEMQVEESVRVVEKPEEKLCVVCEERPVNIPNSR